jgi:plastocyanin
MQLNPAGSKEFRAMKNAFTASPTELNAGIPASSGTARSGSAGAPVKTVRKFECRSLVGGIGAGVIALAVWLGVAGSVSGMTTNVVFQNFSFTPSSVTIQIGDTVVWTNGGGVHTVTGDGSDPFCGSNAIPVSCSETFTEPGTFPYHCQFHAAFGMRGTVIVMPASSLRIVSVSAQPAGVTLTLVGGTPPYAIQRKTGLTDANWSNVLKTTNLIAVLPMTNTAAFFRVLDHFTGTIP